MITSAEEYWSMLYRIQTENAPDLALLLPREEKILNVDLESRVIEAPEFLSVETDHRAETIYFKCPRFYDNIDLATTTCIIQYINAAGEGRLYVVPFYDVQTFSKYDPETGVDEPVMLFPWLIEGDATKAAGEVKYAIRFYKMNGSTLLTYNLNTLVATSKVLHGMDNEAIYKELNADAQDLDIDANYLQRYLDEIQEQIRVANERDLYWLVL